MRPRTTLILAAVLLLVAAGLGPAAAGPARSTSTYDLFWWTVDGGGGVTAGDGGYRLSGTAGQPDAAVWAGPTYTLTGGFWGGAAIEIRLYLPLVLHGAA